MKVWVEVVSLNAHGEEQRRHVLTIERRELAMETLGVNLTEGKTLLAGVQDFVVAQHAREELEQRRACPHCRRRYTSKDSGSTPVSTVGEIGDDRERFDGDTQNLRNRPGRSRLTLRQFL
jgi:hypothetical protein